MSKIKILPENLANQIAAGEVVERPASVVKELVENSIDAGAGRITVQIEGGGSRLIRVIDDGEGMDQDDMLLSLERHATSKLQSSEQMSRILTLGFRGEALPSIASVSRLTITSRVGGATLGSRAEIRFGELRKVHEMGCGQGTVMEIRDLFGNVPARKKFLKSVRTELAHVDGIIVNSALAFPQLGLTYAVDGRTIWSFAAGVDTLAARVHQITGHQSALIEVGGQEHHEVSVTGFLLPPDASCGPSARLRIFVNRRAVRDRMVTHAVAEGLHGFLMKGCGPSGALFLELDPEMIDVNVHPTKQEIRFRQSAEIHQLIVAAVRAAMQRYQKDIQYAVFGAPAREGHSSQSAQGEALAFPAGEAWQVNEPPPSAAYMEKPKIPSLREHGNDAGVKTYQDERVIPLSREEHYEPRPAGGLEKVPFLPDFSGKKRGGGFQYIGQFRNSYLLCESEEGIAVIDQHAAHERLLFERLKKQYMELAVPAQPLLFPEMIECTPEQIDVLAKHGDEFARIGVIIQEFGGESYVIKAVPAILSQVGPREVVQGIFDHFLSNDSKGKGAAMRMDDMLSVMACKAAVKAHDILGPEEGQALLEKMAAADIFSHCPHGRPVVKIFTDSEIKKWFFR
ncbi:MAG: DNA mismatch repair endonuclease MutL [Deltaproteobacteria bacterium]|nr:DNA mismatch repair endonuclease MutL [Deltaproteobacteria bacterium]